METVPPLRLTRLLAASVGVAVVAVLWFATGLARPTPPVVGWIPAFAGVPIAAVIAWRASRAGRTFWRYMAASVVLTGLGAVSTAYDYFTGAQQGQHIGGGTSVLYGLGVAAVLVGLWRIPGAYRTRIEWTRFVLDIATVVVTVLAFAWHELYPRWQGWQGGDRMSMGSSMLVILGAFLTCVLAFVKVAFMGTGPVDRRSLHLLALCGFVSGLGGGLTPMLATRPYLNTTHVLIPLTCVIVSVAADRQIRAAAAGLPAPRPVGRRWSIMPYAAVGATGALLLAGAASGAPDILVLAVASVGVAVLVAARQVVALHDNRQLLGELAHQAAHDLLTGLPNRTVLVREITAELAREPERVRVALIDLDDFKAINDDLGHAVGDALLVAVGERLSTAVTRSCVIARLGGDEYALLLGDDYAADLYEITASLRRPMHAAGHELIVEASIGLAQARPGDTADELLRRADVAMYEAKAHGGGRQLLYTSDMDQRTAEQSRVSADLRNALDTDQLFLLYQPIVSMPGGELYGVESLVRWKHPVRGMVGPVEFIPAAERTGLIVPLGAWILEEACRQAVRWQAEMGEAAPRTVTVNVSARQLRETGFAEEVDAVLQRTGLPPEVLTVEVTETAVFDGGLALAELRAIAALGVKIALDDFGTGHSSLGLLRTCPADVLKVDKSFVDDVTEQGQPAVVVAALIGICDGMGLRAVAEGVETAEQAAELHRLGYRYAQGYFYGRPMPAAEITTFTAAGVKAA